MVVVLSIFQIILLMAINELITILKHKLWLSVRLCDAICENPAYEGTRRTGSDKTPRFLCGVLSEPRLFAIHEHPLKAPFFIPAHFENNLL